MQYPRPTQQSPESILRAASLMLKAMGVPDDEQSLCDMDEALRTTKSIFQAAKSLDYNCWTVSDSDIAVLADRNKYLHNGHMDSLADWVQRHKIMPQCRVGETITFNMDGRPYQGVIEEVKASVAFYATRLLEKDLSSEPIFVPFEWVHDLAVPAEAFQLQAC